LTVVPTSAYLVLSAVLFVIGVLTVLLRRGVITMLMGIELMLNGANVAFVAFGRHAGMMDAHIYVLFIIAVAAAEAAVGLAIVLALFRLRETTDVDSVNLMKW
jgi:NADH-quinone oxidoreductase subunit K